MWLYEECMCCDNFNITSNSRDWRSHRIKNVTARTQYYDHHLDNIVCVKHQWQGSFDSDCLVTQFALCISVGKYCGFVAVFWKAIINVRRVSFDRQAFGSGTCMHLFFSLHFFIFTFLCNRIPAFYVVFFSSLIYTMAETSANFNQTLLLVSRTLTTLPKDTFFPKILLTKLFLKQQTKAAQKIALCSTLPLWILKMNFCHSLDTCWLAS